MVLGRSATGKNLSLKASNDFAVKASMVGDGGLLQTFINFVRNAFQRQVGWHGRLKLFGGHHFGTGLLPFNSIPRTGVARLWAPAAVLTRCCVHRPQALLCVLPCQVHGLAHLLRLIPLCKAAFKPPRGPFAINAVHAAA